MKVALSLYLCISLSLLYLAFYIYISLYICINLCWLSSWAGLEIKTDREGILFVMDRRGRATGEAFVQFESQDDTEQALGRNREKIGHRWVPTHHIYSYTIATTIVQQQQLQNKSKSFNGNTNMNSQYIKYTLLYENTFKLLRLSSWLTYKHSNFSNL